jgi:thiol-disulfide isomerase/thioredoxin
MGRSDDEGWRVVKDMVRSAILGLLTVSALTVALAFAGNAGTNPGYIVPVAAGSAEDPATRQPLPGDLAVYDGSNQPLLLMHFRGNVVLMNFWATWCAPCLKEMPYLDRLQGDLKGMPLAVLEVSEDNGGLPVAKAYLERAKLTFLRPFTDPQSATANKLNVQGLPTSLIIDKRGRLVQRVEGPYEWDNPAIVNRFRALLAEAP